MNHNREAYRQLLDLLTPALLQRIGTGPRFGGALNNALGVMLGGLSRLIHRQCQRQQGPDQVQLYSFGLPVPRNAATTYGECVHLSGEYDPSAQRFLLNHEYVHVLQYRTLGLGFLPAYLLERIKARLRALDPYRDNPYEIQALQVEQLLRHHPWLPDVWDIAD